MKVLGVDLAAGAARTYACTLDDRGGGLRAELLAGCDDDRLLELAARREKVAIDAPFGWPRAFVTALDAHRRFEAWPAPDDGPPEAFRATLSFRLTDRVVAQTRRPLSVSTDKLGVTAMRCAHLLQRWASSAGRADRAGAGKFVEVYPAAALVRWGLAGSGYKGSDRAPLEALTAAVCEALPALEMSAPDLRLCESVHDAFDALVAALVGRAASLGLTDPPWPEAREQAAEEGWIHLPLWGSLALAGRSRGHLRSAPAEALARRLAQLDVAVDTKGYVSDVNDALLPWLSAPVRRAILSELSGKGGSELVARENGKAKFQAAHSSACLAANVFGPWLDTSDAIPLDGARYSGETHLEVECPTGLPGTPPTLDVVVDGPQVLAVESKCTETFEPHRAEFALGYRMLVDELADRTWRAEYKCLVENPTRYRFLDAAQLVKHYLGLRRCFANRLVTLAYLYWEPVNGDEVAACLIHRAEVGELSKHVGDPRVRFVAMPYVWVWDEWAHVHSPAWLGEHARALQDRYAVTVRDIPPGGRWGTRPLDSRSRVGSG
jgi:hypothetical protein